MAMLVKLWRNRYGAPIMREYGDTKYNPVLTTLTYPTRGRRNYYIPGDLILTDVNKLADLQQSYPELERAAKQDPGTLESMLEIGLVFLGIEQAKYKTAWRIESMEPVHYEEVSDHIRQRGRWMGDGYLYMQRLILVEEDTPIPIGPQVHWRMQELNDSWMIWRGQWIDNVQLILDVAQFIAETGVSFGSATVTRVIARRVKTKIAKQLIRRGMRRVLQVAVKTLSKAVTKATVAAITAFIIEMTKQVRGFSAAQRVQQLSGQAARPYSWKAGILAAAPLAVSAFVSSLIDAARKSIFKKIDEFAKDALGLMPDVIESKIKTYLLKEITDVFTTGAIDLLNSAVATAVAESVDSAGNFDEAKFGRALTSALYDKLTSLCQAKVKAIPEAVGDQIAELVTG